MKGVSIFTFGKVCSIINFDREGKAGTHTQYMYTILNTVSSILQVNADMFLSSLSLALFQLAFFKLSQYLGNVEVQLLQPTLS